MATDAASPRSASVDDLGHQATTVDGRDQATFGPGRHPGGGDGQDRGIDQVEDREVGSMIEQRPERRVVAMEQQASLCPPGLGPLRMLERSSCQADEGTFGMGLDQSVLVRRFDQLVELADLGQQVERLFRQRLAGHRSGQLAGVPVVAGSQGCPDRGREDRRPPRSEQFAGLRVTGPGLAVEQPHRHVDRHGLQVAGTEPIDERGQVIDPVGLQLTGVDRPLDGDPTASAAVDSDDGGRPARRFRRRWVLRGHRSA